MFAQQPNDILQISKIKCLHICEVRLESIHFDLNVIEMISYLANNSLVKHPAFNLSLLDNLCVKIKNYIFLFLCVTI